MRVPVLAACVLTTMSLLTSPASAGHEPRATIRYTEHGVPHIVARSFDGLGYGYGFAAAKDNICELANGYLTLSAERSRFLGPDGQGNDALSGARSNLASDLHFQRLNDSGVVEQLLAQPSPQGPLPEVRKLVAGYVDGYNKYLSQGVTDPACRGAAWLRPIRDLDVYRHFYAVAGVAGQGALADALVNSQPSAAAEAPADAAKIAAAADAALGTGDLGSNGIAIGAESTAHGSSVLLGNPHYPWQGGRRFWQSQLTIPGRFDASGASLLGFPLIQIGHTANAAWTHTVATARTVGLYEVPLSPDDRTTYLVDGKPEKMTSTTVRVKVKQPDGSLADVSRQLYSTRYGPVLTSFFGTPVPWTTKSAYALRDANATNLRGLNTWFQLDQAQDTRQVVRALSSTLGAPWVNTMATDRAGNAIYADIQAVPHVTDELVNQCSTPLGRNLFPASGFSILDGSRSACGWGSDPDAVQPGLLGPGKLPLTQRRDYALNANDSPWLANAKAPITGYPRIVGDIGTTRSARTREALLSVDGKVFTTDSMKQLLFGDRSRMAELAAADAAKLCDLGPECAALATWDHRYTLDSRGSLLFQRFVLKLPANPWKVAFDPKDPVNTPNTLDTANPLVRKAFSDAVAELTAAKLPLDAKLADGQAVTRNGERIPIHGAPHALGVLNVVTPLWDPAKGNAEIVHGSSFVQVVGFGRDRCPDTSTLLTYSQSTDATSPYFSDQTKEFSQGAWVRGRFCERDILSSPALRVVRLR
ncbi:acyl-homoserine-lactone acylase [Amycolatopsis xylanica]|uniref:Acyl-homoserine-lactone acylase n=1 Tax=Amycolatopsis xylanica TaxID=589385 RepID=A0A1H3HJL3_9PSEU|nr:penicillin acylase family protein [Amycolatopsis xylanica]SDY15405.1 acyl-homoserine-lactone acylase [Amycolatopsis xylanica]